MSIFSFFPGVLRQSNCILPSLPPRRERVGQALGFCGRPGWYNQGLKISKTLLSPGSHRTMERTARLTFGDQTIELPVVEGSEGELAVDITSLRAQTGLITLDPGFSNTGVGQSSITYVDGENGILRYRGIPVEQ